MKRSLKSSLLIITVIATVGLVFIGCAKSDNKVKEQPVKIVKTITVESDLASMARTFPGVVKSSDKAELSFDISGRLIKLPIKEGQKMTKGQLIAKLEPDTQNFRLNSAQADFLEAQADFKRNKELYSQGVISAAEYQARKRKFEMTKASLDLAKKQLTNTILKAPFAGTLTKKNVENYQYVRQKETIAVLQNLNDLEVEINCPESLMSYENKIDKMSIKARFESYPNKEFSLKLKSKGKQADEVTKTYPVTFYIKDKEGANILPGMTSTVYIKMLVVEDDFIAIPVSAVFMDENKKQCVWVVKDNIAQKVVVEVNELRDSKAIVSLGLENSDRVIISGVHSVLEGDKIKEYERLDLIK